MAKKKKKDIKKTDSGDFSGVQWPRLHAPHARGSGLIPDQGTRSHLLQLRVPKPQLKIPYAATKMEDPKCNT